jgi:hypothetical protein
VRWRGGKNRIHGSAVLEEVQTGLVDESLLHRSLGIIRGIRSAEGSLPVPGEVHTSNGKLT